jgi:hypothetical protein
VRYTFTYTDTKYALKLMGVSFGLFFLFMILLLNFTEFINDYLGPSIYAIISILTPLAIFFLLKKRIGRSGGAEIENGVIHFNLDSRKQDIEINNIESYKIEYNQGIVFRIETRNGKKLKITANRTFCNPSAFTAFVEYFETIIENKNKSSHTKVLRIKSDYEKEGMYYFLLFITMLFLGGIPYIVYLNGNLSGVIYIGFGIVIGGWADYFITKQKFKRKSE